MAQRSPWWRGFVRSLLASSALLALGRRGSTIRMPVAACYQLTYRCQLACSYCRENVRARPASCPPASARRADAATSPAGAQELDTAGAIRTLQALRTLCDVLDLSGGEPLLRTDLDELLGTARALGFQEIVLNTNGLGLLERPELLRHVHAVMLGIDTLREEPFERITAGSRAQQREQLETLETLFRLQGEYGFDLELCTVLLPGQLDEVEPVLEWCFAHDVLVSVSPQIDESLQVAPGLRADPKYRALTARLTSLRREGRPLLGPASYYRELGELGCFACLPLATLSIGPGGEMLWPCGELQQRGPSFADDLPFRAMVEQAEAELGPAPDCRGRCHFSCRMALPLLAARPWELGSELRQWRRYRRFRR